MSLSWPVRFLFRAIGSALVLGAVAMWLGDRVFEWSTGTVPVVLWSAGMAVLIGFVSYRAKRRGVLGGGASAAAVMRALLGGMLLCALLLMASLFVVNYKYGAEWVPRAVLVMVLLYLAMSALSVITLHQELDARKLQSKDHNAAGARNDGGVTEALNEEGRS